MKKRNRIPTLFALGLGTLAVGCGSSPNSSPVATAGFTQGTPIDYEHAGVQTQPSLNLGTYRYIPTGTALSSGASQNTLVDRNVDYGLALRTAAIKLTGDLPSLTDIRRLQAAIAAGANDGTENDPGFVYGDIIKNYIYGVSVNGVRQTPVAFNNQMVQFWRNTFRMGGTLSALFQDSMTDKRTVSLETGPTFAARLVAEEKDMRTLFTQSSNTCPTFDRTSGKFTDGSCFVANGSSASSPGNNVPEGQQAGIITNPGFLAQYFSNFNFRRSRLVNELFTCTRLPSELAPAPVVEGDYLYSSPWPYRSVTSALDPPMFDYTNQPRLLRGGGSSKTTDYVNFRADCQNCHSTQNHRAPLFAVFDQVGYRNPNNLFMVPSTASDSPFAQIQEYLYQCNPDPKNPGLHPCKGAIFWKYQSTPIDYQGGTTNVPDFQSFGKDMAADPTTAKCMMIRIWNNAYSRDDVVNDLALVPDSVISDLTTYFVNNNYNMKTALYKLYTDVNYIRY